MTNTYQVERNIIYKINSSEGIIQNQSGITKVIDEKMLNVLLDWESNKKLLVTEDDLIKYFSQDAKEACDFLIMQGILNKKLEKESLIEHLMIFSSDVQFAKELNDILNPYFSPTLNVEVIQDLSKVKDNALIITYFNPYNFKEIDEHIKTQNELKDSVFLNTYIYDKKFYMDCLYSKDWAIPCHHCHMGHIKMAQYLDESSAISYQGMIDLLYAENQNFQIQYPLNTIQKVNIIRLISNKIQSYLGDLNTSLIHPQDINTCTLLELDSLKVYEDTSLFWEMCDCYE